MNHLARLLKSLAVLIKLKNIAAICENEGILQRNQYFDCTEASSLPK